MAPSHYLTNVDLSSLRSSDIHLRAISLKISQPSVTKISLKIISMILFKSPRGQWVNRQWAAIIRNNSDTWHQMVSLGYSVLTYGSLMLSQPHRMGHGQHPNLKMDMNGRMDGLMDGVRCHYNTVSMIPNPYNRHPIACPWGMGCILWTALWWHPTRDHLWMRPANEIRRYNVTSSLIGWAHPQKDPCPTVLLLFRNTSVCWIPAAP